MVDNRRWPGIKAVDMTIKEKNAFSNIGAWAKNIIVIVGCLTIFMKVTVFIDRVDAQGKENSSKINAKASREYVDINFKQHKEKMQLFEDRLTIMTRDIKESNREVMQLMRTLINKK